MKERCLTFSLTSYAEWGPWTWFNQRMRISKALCLQAILVLFIVHNMLCGLYCNYIFPNLFLAWPLKQSCLEALRKLCAMLQAMQWITRFLVTSWEAQKTLPQNDFSPFMDKQDFCWWSWKMISGYLWKVVKRMLLQGWEQKGQI